MKPSAVPRASEWKCIQRELCAVRLEGMEEPQNNPSRVPLPDSERIST